MAPPEVVSMTPCPLVPAFKERPILFSAPMVRALLDGTKTQTRRVVKPQPAADTFQVTPYHHPDNQPRFYAWKEGFGGAEMHPGWEPIRCPYGQPGDRLYVRETHAKIIGQSGGWIETDYRATYKHGDRLGDNLGIKKKWTPAIHMPRDASRIDLEITGVRVERLQDISREDAKAEGCAHDDRCDHVRLSCAEIGCTGPDYRVGYRKLWEQINGAGSWDANPWVWVVEFQRVRP